MTLDLETDLKLEDGPESVDPDPFPLSPLEKLRKPFPLEVVGILPQLYKKDDAQTVKKFCAECGNTMGPHFHLDYIGHAAVTDRLLDADLRWTWAPMAFDAVGLPALDHDGNLWINLTVDGVTKPGVGDGKNMKEKISDALRNAAMRFGVALYLWSKDELESQLMAPPERRTRRPAPKAGGTPAAKIEAVEKERDPNDPNSATTAQINQLRKTLAQRGVTKDIDVLLSVRASLGREVETIRDCTEDEMNEILRDL